MLAPDHLDEIENRIQRCALLSGAAYEEGLLQISIHDAPLLLDEVRRLQRDHAELVALYQKRNAQYEWCLGQIAELDQPWKCPNCGFGSRQCAECSQSEENEEEGDERDS